MFENASLTALHMPARIVLASSPFWALRARCDLQDTCFFPSSLARDVWSLHVVAFSYTGNVKSKFIVVRLIIFTTVVPFMEYGTGPAAGQNKSTTAGVPPGLIETILGKPQCQVFFGWSPDHMTIQQRQAVQFGTTLLLPISSKRERERERGRWWF